VKILFQPLSLLLASALVASADSNLTVAPDPGTLVFSNLVQPGVPTNKIDAEHYFQNQLDLASKQRHAKCPDVAAQILVGILETNAAPEFKRKALFELALATQDNNELVKAQQIFAQYLQRYPEDVSAPEVMLRQGLLYRQMGVSTLAISKFYAVMSTALKLKLDNIDYYKNLVLQAQTEIADTYYYLGHFSESADYYGRLLKADSPSLDKSQIDFKLIRSLSYLTNYNDTIARAESFLTNFPDYPDLPEVRFILASTDKAVGHNADALKQVLLLLQSQQDNARTNPDLWAYWQRRAGNEIANELYKEGDYLDALQIYQNLAALDKTTDWQAPALYQVGLVYEQLQQWQKATDTYDQILARRSEMTATNAAPSLASLCEMAQWRKDYIAWLQKARAANLGLQRTYLYKPSMTKVTAAR
jgi:tetratricopeptide (TPR) repeat protein